MALFLIVLVSACGEEGTAPGPLAETEEPLVIQVDAFNVSESHSGWFKVRTSETRVAEYNMRPDIRDENFERIGQRFVELREAAGPVRVRLETNSRILAHEVDEFVAKLRAAGFQHIDVVRKKESEE